MHRSGNDFNLIINLPRNSTQQYKFIVDGQWKFSNKVEHQADANGNVNNILDLRNFQPLDETSAILEDEVYEDSEFTSERITKDKFIEPPALPPIYRNIPIGKPISTYPSRAVPHNSVINHLYCSILKEVTSIKGCLVSGCVVRYKEKYTNVAYYTVLKFDKL